MEDSDFRNVINDFSAYFGIPLKNLTFSFDNKIPIAHIEGKNDSVQGFRNLISQVSKPENLESEILQDQWVEYAITHLGNSEPCSKHDILKDVNGYMVDKVYFVGNSLGPVDILMYYVLYNLVAKLTFQEKEKYLNVSRWLNNVQQNKNVRIWRSLIPFSRSCLYF